MASQLGSAITPTGHQAYSDLLGTEMQQRAMAQQAFQNQQNMGLAQQQMGMQADQFAAMQQEAQTAREHELMKGDRLFQQEQTLLNQKQQFDKAQQDAMMKWQQQQTYDVNKMNLEIAQMEIQAQEAAAQGQYTVAQQILAQRQATRKLVASRAQRMALANAALGKSKEQVNGMLDSLVQNYEQLINSKQQEMSMAKSHAPAFLGRLAANDLQSNIDAYNKVKAEKLGGFNYNFAPLAPDISEVLGQVQAGELPGFEYVNIDPSMWGRLTGLFDFTELSSAKMVGGVADADTISKNEQRKLSTALVEQLKGMKIPNFNETAASQAIELALSGGDKGQIAQVVQKSGVPMGTLHYLLNEAVLGSEENNTNPEWVRLNQLSAKYLQQYGAQKSLQAVALDQAKNAMRTRAQIARRGAFAFEGGDTTLEDMRSAFEMLQGVRKTGQMSSAADTLLGRLEPARAGDLRKAMAAVPGAQAEMETAMRELGDLTEMQTDDDALAALMAEQPGLAQISAQRSGIDRLIKGLGARP